MAAPGDSLFQRMVEMATWKVGRLPKHTQDGEQAFVGLALQVLTDRPLPVSSSRPLSGCCHFIKDVSELSPCIVPAGRV